MANIVIFVVLLFLGYFFGRIAEARHFRSIIQREQAYRDLLCFSTRHLPEFDYPVTSRLVEGNVVVSVDYFKRIAAGLRALLGGRVSAYETLVERARREALLRMKEHARACGASHVFNVKLETSSISKGQRDQIGCVEVYAYGTAISKAG